MIARLGRALSAAFEKTAPDPFSLAILLTVLTAIVALAFGTFPSIDSGAAASIDTKLIALLDTWRHDKIGLWRFLAFSMQMCFILVTGHALAASRPVRTLIELIARLPRSGATAAAAVGLFAAVLGLVNWGLGLIAGALLAREVGRSLARRGIPHHYPLLAAAGYCGMLVWHGGLSGSAPITMTKASDASSILPADLLESTPFLSLTQTVFSPMNLVVSGGLLVIIPLVLFMLSPKDGARPYVETAKPPAPRTEEGHGPRSLPDWLDRTPALPILLAALILIATVRYGMESGLTRVGLNEINAFMLALGLVLHGSLSSYARAAEDAARGCAGIILQFPLYAGIMGLLSVSGLIAQLSAWLAGAGGETGVPVLTFLSAAITNLFVPSGGGQWGIQGPIALESGLAAGVEPGKMVMAVAYGDQLTNMLQPFWALPLLAITGVKARELVGYTAVVMLAAGAWMLGGLVLF